ncbi:hypothetical protein V8G54_008319 [Vigna mungo]|uniref:Uncharacterized protein n=1 Tax=Vigna mungo TaxID=3915 RepID=A0AAQ3P5D8_VIGMU
MIVAGVVPGPRGLFGHADLQFGNLRIRSRRRFFLRRRYEVCQGVRAAKPDSGIVVDHGRFFGSVVSPQPETHPSGRISNLGGPFPPRSLADAAELLAGVELDLAAAWFGGGPLASIGKDVGGGGGGGLYLNVVDIALDSLAGEGKGFVVAGRVGGIGISV